MTLGSSSRAALLEVAVLFGVQRTVMGMSVGGRQLNSTLAGRTSASADSVAVTTWRGMPIAEIEPSKYPEFMEWLNYGPPPEDARLAQAKADGKYNKGPSHFPDLQSYMDRCQAKEPDVVEIPTWMGRMGNRIWQILNAVRIAEATGRSFVKVPAKGGGLDHLIFDNPKDLLIKVDTSKTKRSCDFVPVSGKMYQWHHDCRFLFFNRCKTTVADRKEAYNKYILPLLKKGVTETCAPGEEDAVTIHVRNGDVALHTDRNPEMRPEHRQPPCAYFHKVIEEGHNGGPFKKVQLVYSREEPYSPCIDDIFAKHKDKVVLKPATSLAGDVCHIMRAKNVATTMSSFATVLKMMNPGLEHLLFVNTLSTNIMTQEQYNIQMDYYEFNVKEACEVFPKVTSYAMPELYMSETFFLSYSKDSFVTTTCETEKGDQRPSQKSEKSSHHRRR